MKPPFEFIDHTADYAMRARGRDLRELLEHAGRGLIHLMADVEGLTPAEHVDVSVSGEAPEDVLVHLLKEMLYLREEGMLPVAVEVLEASPDAAFARMGVVDLEPHLDRLQAAVKAVTYHALEIARDADGLSVQVVFDT